MPRRGLAYCFPITTAVVHPQPTTGALHLRQIGLCAVMGLKPQPGPNSIAITVAWNCDPDESPRS